MRIAVYKDVMTSGRGADRATGALANAWAQRGHEVHLFTQCPPKGAALSVKPDARVQVHFVQAPPRKGWRWTANRLLLKTTWGAKVLRRYLPGCDWVMQMGRRVREAVAEVAPEVLISAGSNELCEVMAEGAVPWPVIQMFHVYPPTCFEKDKYQRVARFKAALPLASVCQVLLPSYRALLAPYTHAPVEVIGNAVDFGTPPEPQETRKPQVVYVAYFTKDKNHEALLEAFAQLKQAEAWTLELYGGGTPAWEARLRKKVEALGIAERVHFNGVVANPGAAMRQAAICAFPSRVEGFPLSLLEAMGLGLACVGFAASPGVSDLLAEPEGVGLLASAGSQALAGQLQQLIDHANLRAKVGEAAARAVRERYAEATVLEAWERLLQRTAQKKEDARAPKEDMK